ncbi:MAG: hypothetical protein HYX43_04520 [Burkholderiales bacterium]|nr:hypothetical protein [Burkholderiales bacterium]
MNRAALLFSALVAARPAAADDPAADLSYKTRLVAEDHGLRGDSIFAPGLPLTSFGRDRGRIEQEVRGRLGPASLLLTGTAFGQEGQTPTARLLANEAYVDFRAGENHFTVGKKILSGDVGYGFRPIDVIQREVRLQVLQPALEGVPNVAWERFTKDTAWSVILVNPGHRQRGDPKHDGSFTLRHYRRIDASDLHAVARISDRYRLETGAAISTVPNESLELHASFLVQRRGEQPAPLAEPATTSALLDPGRAVGAATVNTPRKLLAGFTWTWESGWSVIAETWWDGTAPSAADWQTLAAQARQRNALLGLPGVPAAAVAGSLAASTRLFQAPSVSRRSALVHLGWTDPAGGGWTASLDILRTLEDGGWTATAAAGREADRVRFDAGIRRFGGKPDSVYRLLPEWGILFAGVSLAF